MRKTNLCLIRLKPSKRRRLHSDKAFAKFLMYVEGSIAPTPLRETECEARVRVFTDMLTRCKLAEVAGLRFKTANGWDDIWEIRQLVETRLADAIRDLKFERGDF